MGSRTETRERVETRKTYHTNIHPTQHESSSSRELPHIRVLFDDYKTACMLFKIAADRSHSAALLQYALIVAGKADNGAWLLEERRIPSRSLWQYLNGTPAIVLTPEQATLDTAASELKISHQRESTVYWQRLAASSPAEAKKYDGSGGCKIM